MATPLRQIVERQRYRTASHPRGTYSVLLTLSCGHVVHRKGSAEPAGTHARCRECGSDLPILNPKS
jgi:hypothetical protein